VDVKAEPANRFEKNAPGPFYTTGECLACGAPEVEAPGLLAPLEGETYDTYFVRQPSTADEVEQACRAMEVCCTTALRYGGHDPAIILRLGNDPQYCDHPLPYGPHPASQAQPEGVPEQARGRGRWWRFWGGSWGR
jgi:hypothetical protein